MNKDHLLQNSFFTDYVKSIKPAVCSKPLTVPKISIVTSYYNGNDLIFDTAACILGQTFQDFEWLVVNDGSFNEDSLVTLEKFSRLDPRIKILTHSKNKGLPAGRNTGIKAAKGEFIFFIDSDDLLDITSLEKFYLFLKSNPEMAFVNSYVVGFGNQNYLWPKGFEQHEKFLDDNYNTSSFLARKSVFEQLEFNETITGGFEDWDFWLHAASFGFWGYTIKEFLFWYRRNDHAAKWDNWQSNEKREAFISNLKEKYKLAFHQVGAYHEDLNRNYGTFPVQYNTPEPYKVAGTGNQKMLFILPWLNLGGADKFNLDLIEGLVKKGWDITIITTLQSNHPWEEQFAKFVKKIFHLPNLGGYQHYLEYLDRFIVANQPDVVLLSNSMHGYYSLPFLKSKFPQIPVLDYIHCDDPDWLNGGYPRLNTIFSHLLDKTIVASNQLRNWIETRQQKNKKNAPIDVCYINIDVKNAQRDVANRARIRDEWKINDDFKIILYAARLTDQKQPLVMLESIRQLFQKAENFVCIVCGDGPYFNELKEKVETLGLGSKIWIMGALKHQEVLNLMDASDIFFLPSKYEGIALSIYEAIAKELLIVGANVGGQKELVTEDCGFLIEPSNPTREAAEYSEILYNTISNSGKSKPYTKKAFKKLSEKFDISVMHANMHQHLQHAAKSRSTITNAINAADFSFLYNAFWNKELAAGEVWNQYIYVKEQLNSINPQSQLVDFESLNWYQSENTKLKEWYHNEYEILPIWYKRVGHLIKVVQGKRSLKSLIKKQKV